MQPGFVHPHLYKMLFPGTPKNPNDEKDEENVKTMNQGPGIMPAASKRSLFPPKGNKNQNIT